MKPNIVPNCIRSESYMITFEVEEEKYIVSYLAFHTNLWETVMSVVLNAFIFRFPLFGKKYQLKFANDPSAETHCLVHFPSLIRLSSNF